MNKKYLVTGAEGFIGSHLVEYLLKKNEFVRAFVLYNFQNSSGWLDTIKNHPNLEIYYGDIRDFNSIKNAISGCNVIFHLAALIGIPYSYVAPRSYIDTNIQGTLNILQSCQELNVSKLIITSTSEVYGTAKYVPIDEKHPRQPQSPYSASKIAADALSESFFNSFDTNITIVRPFNTYGPRQSARAIIPSIIIQLLNNKDLELGDLTPTRDLVYVTDTVNGFYEISKSNSLIGQDCNIATMNEISMKDLTDMLINKINPSAKIKLDKKRMRPKDSEVYRLLGSNKKLKINTNWEQKVSLEEGLDFTIEWFKKNLNNFNEKNYNI